MLKVKKVHCIAIFAGLLALAFVIVYLIEQGQNLALMSWWLITYLLLPSLVGSLLVNSFALKFFISVCFFTQFIGVPWFVLNAENYTYSGWSAVKNFNFTIYEFLQIYFYISLFLIAVVIFFVSIRRVWQLPTIYPTGLGWLSEQKYGRNNTEFQRDRSREGIFAFTLFLIVVLLIPLNFWMFKNGISLVGVQPPRLPFKLTGGLYYITKYFIPVLLFYLYARTSRRGFSSYILMFYALIAGTSQVSRSSSMFMLMPVLFFAFFDNRKILLTVSTFWSLFCFQIASLMRNVIYISVEPGERAIAETSTGFIDRLFELISTQVGNINLLDMSFSIVGRIESPQSMVLGFQFQPEAIGGAVVMLKRFFYQGWVNIDIDAYHLEWIGSTLPYGFVSVGGYLSYALLLAKANLGYLFLLAFLTALYIYFGELIVRRLTLKYRSIMLYYSLLIAYIVMLVINFGTKVWWGGIFTLIVILLIPRCNFAFITGRLTR